MISSGSRGVAQTLRASLGAPWKLATATLDDFGPQTAKVYATVPGEGVKQIDFLAAIVGIAIGVPYRLVETNSFYNGGTQVTCYVGAVSAVMVQVS